MSVMTVDGYGTRIEYDAERDEFRGEVLGLSSSAKFYGRSSKALRSEFRKSLGHYTITFPTIDPSAGTPVITVDSAHETLHDTNLRSSG